MKRAIIDIDDELSPIEQEFVQQTTDSDDDDNTEVEDNYNNNNGAEDENSCGTVSSNQSNQKLTTNELCKIIVCDGHHHNGNTDADLASLATDYYYKQALNFEDLKSLLSGLEKYNSISFSIQCAYCTIESQSGSIQSDDFWVHFVKFHPEFPILAYDLSLLNKNSNDIPLDIKTRNKKYAFEKFDFTKYSDSINDLNKIDEDLAAEVVTKFREKLGNNYY